MTATPQETVPVRKHVIDPSAWTSGLAMVCGVMLAGPQNILRALQSGGAILYALPLAYIAFFISVMLIQRYMAKSILSTTFGTPQQLVTSGVFKYSQNPIYVAFFMPLLSLAAVSWVGAIGGLIIYVLTMEFVVLRPEAAELEKIFGQDFRNWQARTPKWILI